MTHNNKFISKEYMKNLYPIMFSVLGGTINALIDGAFVSQRLGNEGLAAVNVSMPVYLVICTIGSLIAGGAVTLSAQAAGKERMHESENYYRSSIWILLIAGIILTTIGALFCRPLAGALAQNGSMTDYVFDYCLLTLIGTVPTVLLYIPMFYLQLEGKRKEISIQMVIIILTDVLFDYLLMFVINLGIIGAALASIISTTLACIYGFVMLSIGYSNYHFSLKKPDFSGINKILVMGSPLALGNFEDAVKLLLLNAILLNDGGTAMVAMWAVINSLSEFAMSITSGVPQAAAPMSGTYYSARENNGLRMLVNIQVNAGIILSLLYTLILVICHGFIESLFAQENDLTLPIICLGVYCIFDVLCMIWTTFFQSTDKVKEANILTFFRKLLFPIGVAAVLSWTGWYIWLFLPLGAALTLIGGYVLTGIRVRWSNKGDRPLSRYLLLDDYLERENRVIDFSIVPTSENICNASEQITEFCEANNMNAKQTMKLGLAIEELMTVIADKNDKLDSVDLRAFSLVGTMGIRIRCAGIQYNPFENKDDDNEDYLMGVIMINKMAEVVNYTYSLGMNTINILFEKS